MDLSTILPSPDSPRAPTIVRSPFCALPGFTDKFDTVHDLCETVRGRFLEESAVPYIPIAPKETGAVPWNAYLFDFFKHGDMETLKSVNQIKGGDVWYHLKDFSLILSSIVTSIAKFLGLPNADDEFGFEEEDDLDMADDDGPQVSGSAWVDMRNDPYDTSPPRQMEQQKKKAKREVIAESWDAESSDEDTEEATKAAPKGGSPSYGSASGYPQATSWAEDGGRSLMQIFRTFSALRHEFEERSSARDLPED